MAISDELQAALEAIKNKEDFEQIISLAKDKITELDNESMRICFVVSGSKFVKKITTMIQNQSYAWPGSITEYTETRL